MALQSATAVLVSTKALCVWHSEMLTHSTARVVEHLLCSDPVLALGTRGRQALPRATRSLVGRQTVKYCKGKKVTDMLSWGRWRVQCVYMAGARPRFVFALGGPGRAQEKCHLSEYQRMN